MSVRPCIRCFRIIRVSRSSRNPEEFRFHSSQSRPFSTQTSGSSVSSPKSPPANSQHGDPNPDPISSLESAKARAWYLDPLPPSSVPSTSTSIPSVPTSTNRPGPTFTTFDPTRTTSSTHSTNIHPLPRSAPRSLGRLHTFLTTEASDVVEIDTVRVYESSKAVRSVESVGEDLPRRVGQGRRRRRAFNMGSPGIGEDEGTEYNDGQEGFGENGDKAWGDEPGEIIQGVQGFGARWDWVVVLQVKGRGKGVVGRAERVIRQWLHENPLDDSGPPKNRYPKHPSPPAETDWSLIDVSQGRGGENLSVGICINLLTAEGRERWGLEDVWASREG